MIALSWMRETLASARGALVERIGAKGVPVRIRNGENVSKLAPQIQFASGAPTAAWDASLLSFRAAACD